MQDELRFCKQCGAALKSNQDICGVCGYDNAVQVEKPAEEAPKSSPAYWELPDEPNTTSMANQEVSNEPQATNATYWELPDEPKTTTAPHLGISEVEELPKKEPISCNVDTEEIAEKVYFAEQSKPEWGVGTDEKKGNKKFVIIGIVAMIVLALVVGIFVLGKQTPKTQEKANNSEAVQVSEKPDKTATPKPTPTPTPTPKPKKYTRGKLIGSTYESEFLGIRYTAPAGWEMLDEKAVQDMSTDKEFCEMMTVNSNTNSYVQIITIKPADNEIIFLDWGIQQGISAVEKSLIDNGWTNTDETKMFTGVGSYDVSKEELLGEEYSVAATSLKKNSAKISVKCYGKHCEETVVMIMVVVNESAGDTVEGILSNIKAY